MAEQEAKEGAAPVPAGRWLRVELMGHQEMVGLAREVEEFGVRLMHVCCPCPDGHLVDERYINPRAALYGFRPVDEEKARRTALEICNDPSHRVWCTYCGLARLGGRQTTCTACGCGDLEMCEPGPMTAANLPRSYAQWPLVRNAGAEPVPADAVAEGASSAKYNAQFEFNHILEDKQRAAAVAWALAFHRHRLEIGRAHV